MLSTAIGWAGLRPSYLSACGFAAEMLDSVRGVAACERTRSRISFVTAIRHCRVVELDFRYLLHTAVQHAEPRANERSRLLTKENAQFHVIPTASSVWVSDHQD